MSRVLGVCTITLCRRRVRRLMEQLRTWRGVGRVRCPKGFWCNLFGLRIAHHARLIFQGDESPLSEDIVGLIDT